MINGEVAKRVFKAHFRGDPYSTDDAKIFLKEADGVVSFLWACGPQYSLVASDLNRVMSSIADAIERRYSDQTRNEGFR